MKKWVYAFRKFIPLVLWPSFWTKPYPLSWVSGQPALCVSAESLGFTGFPLPRQKLLTLHSHPSVPPSIPLSPSVLFTRCSPAAVPPRRHSRPPRSWRPPRIGQWRPSPWEWQGEVLEWAEEWRWRWLSGGEFLRFGSGLLEGERERRYD